MERSADISDLALRLHIEQLQRLVQKAAEEAVSELALTPLQMQTLTEKSNEVSAEVKAALHHSIMEFFVSDDFSEEEVLSTQGYYSGYNRPRSVESQLKLLHTMFPDLSLPEAIKPITRLPQGAEGIFLVPKWELLGDSKTNAIEKVLQKLQQQRRKFIDHRIGRHVNHRLRQTKRTQQFLNELTMRQGNPSILQVPAQFGIRHGGRSTRRSRAVLVENEFGLGVYEVAIMLLLHSDRLSESHDLAIECIGDEYEEIVKDDGHATPVFRVFHGDVLEFADGPAFYARSDTGAATAFLLG